MTTPPCANANPPALSELGAMGDEELNVRLAELCGWTQREATRSNPVQRDGIKLPNHFGDDCIAWWHEGRKGVFIRPPNFTTDANAVAEVRKGLSEDERHWFSFNVQRQLEMDLTSFVRDFQACFQLIDANLRIQTIALILCKTH